jgi:CPA2 family monovalent cation:H+ antiporter-2
MPHDVTLIATIAISFVLAFVLGYTAIRLRLQPLVGYLIAGVVIGRAIGASGDEHAMADQLAEIGVMLLMFGVGLHFSLSDLLAVRRIAVPGALALIVLATAVGAAMATAWGWSVGAGLVFGLSLSVASTVVLLKALEERNGVSTPNGRVVVGWLIVEDLAMVVVLVLLPALAEVLGGTAGAGGHGEADRSVLATLAITIGKVGAFVVVALLLGPRVMPLLLKQVARTGSRELFTLAVLAIALGIAYGANALLGVSYALGAFFAGMVLNESALSHKAAVNSMPLQDAFSVLFFVSVGMKFDPSVLTTGPLLVLGTLVLVLVVKAVAAWAIVLAMGYPRSTALLAAASTGRVGEFSFILGGLGIVHGLLPPEGLNLVLAAAVLSISATPLVFAVADRLTARAAARPTPADERRRAKFDVLRDEMETAHEAAAERARHHETFTPESLVERFPLFQGLTPEQREVLVLHFQPLEARPGDRLVRKGERADRVYFINEGEVEVAAPGKKIALAAGDYFGEMALLSGQPRSADVTALDYGKFSTLSQRDFRSLLRKFPSMRAEISARAAARGEQNRAFLESLVDAAHDDAAEEPAVPGPGNRPGSAPPPETAGGPAISSRPTPPPE